MCVEYVVPSPDALRVDFNLESSVASPGPSHIWPGAPAWMIRRPLEADAGDDAVPDREALPSVFGLLPHWAKGLDFSRHTYNARTETVAEKPSYKTAWAKAQHCIVPAAAIYEPEYLPSGKAMRTRIERADGRTMGIAGLWTRWRAPEGTWYHSHTMLTVNADQHPFMRRFHKPGDEKRAVVLLEPEDYDAWLRAPLQDAMAFMRIGRADALVATGAEAYGRK